MLSGPAAAAGTAVFDGRVGAVHGCHILVMQCGFRAAKRDVAVHIAPTSIGLVKIRQPLGLVQLRPTVPTKEPEVQFDHIGIVVAELPIGRQILRDHFLVTSWTKTFSDPVNDVHVQFGRAATGPCYELVAPISPHSPVQRALRYRQQYHQPCRLSGERSLRRAGPADGSRFCSSRSATPSRPSPMAAAPSSSLCRRFVL